MAGGYAYTSDEERALFEIAQEAMEIMGPCMASTTPGRLMREIAENRADEPDPLVKEGVAVMKGLLGGYFRNAGMLDFPMNALAAAELALAAREAGWERERAIDDSGYREFVARDWDAYVKENDAADALSCSMHSQARAERGEPPVTRTRAVMFKPVYRFSRTMRKPEEAFLSAVRSETQVSLNTDDLVLSRAGRGHVITSTCVYFQPPSKEPVYCFSDMFL